MAIKKSSSSGIPFGNNAGRPANPGTGQLYSNGEAARLELYTATGWQNIVQEVPGVASITGNYSEATNSGTITIQGTNFVSGAIASAIGTNGVEVVASSTTYNSLVQLTATFSGLSNANEPYDIKVTNPSNLFGLIPDALYVNSSPVWQTASGSLGTVYDSARAGYSVSVLATDSESNPLAYTLVSGTLPPSMSLNTSTGAITGTPPQVGSDTTYSFVLSASDGLNTIPRSFSITVKAPTTQTLNGSGTFTALTTGTVTVEMLGAGGGGGTGNGAWASGGGGGGYLLTRYNTVAGQSYSYSVGLAGPGQTVCDNSLHTTIGKGGNSIFASLVAGGGNGGNGSLGGGEGGSNTTTGALSVTKNYVGQNGGNTSGEYNNFGGSNGLRNSESINTYGSGAAGVPNGTAGTHATGNGNGGAGGPSCQGGAHRGGGNGSAGIIKITY